MGGVYNDSFSEEQLHAYETGMAESVPKNAPASDFADPPRGLYVGDADHARMAVQAVTSGFRGNKAKSRHKPAVKNKIAAAIRKFYKGKQQEYYLSWLHSGKKPTEKPAAETRVSEMYIAAPSYTMDEESRFPNVPPSSNVDLDALTRNDPNPVFVTRPLAILGAISENGLLYNEAIYRGVLDQVNQRHPVARRGHIADGDKSSAFPLDDGYWIGAVEDNTVYGKPTIFGKCYVVPGETREMVLRRRAAGTGLSNSLWGDVTEAEDEHGNMQPVAVRIESIDFVPEERAALQALGGGFKVTSEMKEDPTMSDNDADDKTARLKESWASVTVQELHEALQETGQAHKVCEMHLKSATCSECTGQTMREMLTSELRRQVAESYFGEEATPEETYKSLKEAMRKSVAEAYAKETNMRLTPEEEAKVQEGALSEMKTVTTRMSEMETEIKLLREANQQYQREKFDRAMSDAIDGKFKHLVLHTEDGVRKIAALKSNLKMHATAEMAGSSKVEDIEPAVTRAYESDNFKPLAEMTVASLAGPNAFTGVNEGTNGQASQLYGYDPKTGRYSLDGAKEARSQANF